MPTSFEKRTVLLIHWSVVLLTASVLYFGDPLPGFSLNNWLILFLLAAHAGLTLLGLTRLDDSSLAYFVMLSDIAGACLAAWLSDAPGSTAYVLLFASLIIAATVRSSRLVISLSAGLGLVYPAILRLGGWPLENVHWLTALLLTDCSLFFGHLALTHRKHADQLKASSIYTNLSAFSEGLSSVEPKELPDRIPRSIMEAMGVDNCELAFIDSERITKRILPNRHCRDYDGIAIGQSVHARAVVSTGVYVSSEMQEDPAFTSKKDFSLYPYRTYMAKAWTIQGKPAGVIALYTEKKMPWSEYSKQQFQFLVEHSILALQNAKLRQELENQAQNDGLTGLLNHRYFYDRLEDEVERAKRKNHFLSVALIDLDHFKKLNDSAGHRVGDQVLQELGHLLRNNIRRTDLAGRLGGDEFAVALQETTGDEMLMLCRRILDTAAKAKVGQQTGFSLSIGCATFPADGETFRELMEHADQALYHSKNLGRGRVSRYAEVVGQKPR